MNKRKAMSPRIEKQEKDKTITTERFENRDAKSHSSRLWTCGDGGRERMLGRKSRPGHVLSLEGKVHQPPVIANRPSPIYIPTSTTN